MHALLLFSLIVGCEKPTTIDEACPKRTPGENKVSAEAAETLQRINCYRKLAGLSSGKAHPAVTEVSEAHVAYMEANDFDASMFSSDLWMAEEPTAEGFTGEDIWKRLHYKGFKSDNSLEFGAWLLGAISPLRRSAMVDYWVQEPKVREMFLQPGWRGAGYAELPAPGESKNQMYYTELDVVYRFPSSAHSAQPIVYPVHNQVDVPTQISTFGALTDYDTELEHVGYPITVTVSSAESDVVSYDEPNPYGLFEVEATLDGPQGSVELLRVYPPALRHSIAFVPEEPLEPGAEYLFEATVEWNARRRSVYSYFTTASSSPEQEDTQ